MHFDPIIFKDYANQVSEKVSRLNVDIIFSPWTIPVATLESDHPIVSWGDATFAGLKDFYPDFSNLCGETAEGVVGKWIKPL